MGSINNIAFLFRSTTLSIYYIQPLTMHREGYFLLWIIESSQAKAHHVFFRPVHSNLTKTMSLLSLAEILFMLNFSKAIFNLRMMYQYEHQLFNNGIVKYKSTKNACEKPSSRKYWNAIGFFSKWYFRWYWALSYTQYAAWVVRL